MGSIASTLYSINSSLLSEISNDLSATQATSSSASSSTEASGNSTSSSDSLDFSQVAQLFHELQQLQTTNPAEFTKVTADAASKLQQAAQQATNPSEASFLEPRRQVSAGFPERQPFIIRRWRFVECYGAA